MFIEKRFGRVWISAGLFIIFLGLIFEIALTGNNSAENSPVNWPTVVGSVKAAEVRAVSIDGGTSIARRPLVVSYIYLVNNVSYAGTQEIVNPTPASMSDFAVGKQIRVYYNQTAPLQSVVDPNQAAAASGGQPLLSGPKNVLLLSAVIASLPFLGIGVGLLLTGKKSQVRHRSRRRRLLSRYRR